MTDYVELAAGQILGDLPAPMKFEFTFGTAPNRLYGRIARRTIGNPSNWRSTYEAEAATGSGALVADSDASGASNNARSFALPDTAEQSCVWTENTNIADRVGQVQVFAVLKDFDTVAGRFLCAVDLAIGGVAARAGSYKQPSFQHLSGGAYEAVYLDTFIIPASPLPANWSWTFKVKRIAGSSFANVRLDRLFLVPLDESVGIIEFTSPSDISGSSSKKFVFDTRLRRAYYGSLSGGQLAPAIFGAGVYGQPGVKNRFLFDFSADPGLINGAPYVVPKHTPSPLTSVDVRYTPRYRR